MKYHFWGQILSKSNENVNYYNFIMSKDYVLFARNSGFNQYKFAAKELIVSIIYISTSRIPILFGSMIMVEIMSKGVYEGIGVAIWKHIWTIQELNYNASFGTTFLCVIVFSFLYYLIHNSVLKLSFR